MVYVRVRDPKILGIDFTGKESTKGTQGIGETASTGERPYSKKANCRYA